ncbi:hypothetical protein K8I31_09615, partial [bacterium]|nr:hypothetical protein [bacterium]
VALIDEVLPIVENLRSAWTEAVEKFNQEQMGGAPAEPNEKAAATFDSMAANLNKPKAAAPTPISPSALKPKAPGYQPAAFSSPTQAQPAEERPRLNIRG